MLPCSVGGQRGLRVTATGEGFIRGPGEARGFVRTGVRKSEAW